MWRASLDDVVELSKGIVASAGWQIEAGLSTESTVKVNGLWRCVYRAFDQYGQVHRRALLSPP
ncbi:hypothetical protein KZZ52_15140 [Dactylosporangium sp. AC04546]|uniref:hypothetical protein n=1 Tax=Dactylosporangium sp. AC04546 TaxID=2862460 RepID=UPI002E7B00EA|nr:hypothetical protein [Dactylosporangium sp. AC04546]WVK86646.1 hypothetical protein KZZ52_15140 [Dactylosporangium sp. AC04546]